MKTVVDLFNTMKRIYSEIESNGKKEAQKYIIGYELYDELEALFYDRDLFEEVNLYSELFRKSKLKELTHTIKSTKKKSINLKL